MAPNTSSLYNKPAAADAPADNAVMVSATPAPAPPSDATSAASASPTATTMTSSSSIATASPSSPDDVCLGPSAPRFSPSLMGSVKGRKSCLKRPMTPPPRPAPAALVAPEKAKEPVRPVQKNRRRCWECRAKVGLAAVTCRCEYTFCNKHRYAEEHHCSFNFKTAGKRKLEEDNPRIVPAKVARIN